MSEIKNVIGIVAVVLTFIGYIPYVKDVFKGKTIPHVYSWFLWGLVTLIAFGIQFSSGGGAGSYVTLTAAFLCTIVCIIGLTRKGKKDITTIDTVFFVFAFIALILWLIAKQPVISAILATSIDLLGFAPTIRKSWHNPFTETLSFYLLNTLRFTLAVFALQTYTITTVLYPIAWIFGNGLFGLMLIWRRGQLKNKF